MRRTLMRVTVVLWALSCCMWPSRARCANSCSVILRQLAGYEAFFSRLQAEIRIAGFDTVEQSTAGVPGDSDIETTLQSSCALVFIRPLSRTVALYYRTRDGRLLRTVMPLPVSVEEEQVTALHIAELLRVTFHAPHRKSIPVPKMITAPSTEPRPGWMVDAFTAQLGMRVLWSVRDAPPQLGMDGEIGFQVWRLAVASLSVEAPLRRVSLAWPEGQARFYLGNAGLNIGLRAKTGWLRPVVRVGYQLWFLKANPSVSQGFEGAGETQMTSGPSLFAGGVFVVPRKRVGIVVGGTVSVHTVKTEYTVASRPMATIGYVLPGITVGLTWLPGTE